MRIQIKQCDICKGSGEVQELQELRSDGSWVRNISIPADMADAWIARDGMRSPLRWHDLTCPKCGGSGKVEIEMTACMIF